MTKRLLLVDLDNVQKIDLSLIYKTYLCCCGLHGCSHSRLSSRAAIGR